MKIEIDQKDKKCVCITGSGISYQNESKEKIQGSDAKEITFVELAEIIDVQAIQFLMDDFYKLVHMPIGLNDLKGKVLAGAGWQDICTKFHWVHPEACKHCIGSGTKLSEDVLRGETKLYKCKNNMWDITAPIMVGSLHVGYIFSGQFFFDDELLDYEHFRSQARKYGFDEEEYLIALEKVPRLSREAVETGMSFFLKFANLLSQLSYSNTKLAQSLAEHDTLVDVLKEREKNERIRSEELEVILDAVPAAVLIAHDPWALKMTGNRLSYEWLRLPEGSNISKSAQERARNEAPKLFKNGVEIPLADMPARLAASGKELHDYELDLVDLDGSERHLLGNARPLQDDQGNSRGSVSAFIDITERKKAEEALRKSLEMQKTLKTVINKSPAIAFLWKNKENWPAEFVSENITQLGYTVEDFISGNILYGDIIHEEDIEAVKENLARLIREGYNSFEMEYRIFTGKGEIRWVEERTFIQRDSEGDVTHFQGIVVDVTERKWAEEALKKAHYSLEGKIKERTTELEIAFNSLKKSENSLAEAQKIAHMGSWEWDIAADKAYWSDEMYRIVGRNPQEGALAYDKLLNYVKSEDRDYVVNIFKIGPRKDPHFIDFRISLATGEERTVHMKSETIFEGDTPVLMKGTIQDITERTRSEEKIRNLAHIVESSSDAIGTISPDGIITSWNKGAELIYGYSAEEILGKHVAFVAPDHLRDETKKLSERINQRESINHYETVRLRKDGKIINVSITISPVFDSRGKITAISFISRDITENKAVEEKNKLLAHVVESSNDAIGTLSLDGIITSWNKGAEHVYGYSAEEILGMPASIVSPSHLIDETKNLSEKIQQGKSIRHYETLRLRKDGKSINVSITLSPVFDSSGKMTAISFISRDITENKAVEEKLRESEEKYRNIVETANEGILIIDKEAIITFANNRMEDMLGYARREGIGRPIWDFLSEESKAIVKLNLKNRFLGMDDSYELKLIKKDGSILWTSVNAKPLFDKDDNFVGSMSMLTDITRRKEAEQALANFEISREREIHHRIKNNLQVVSSLLDLQAYKFKGRRDINDSEVMDAFRESQNRVISMALIHEELYKRGGLEAINFSEYVDKLADHLLSTYQLGAANITLIKNLEENLFFDMDTAIPLGTIINELVSNSFKHAFPGRDKGEVRIILHREEGDFIKVQECKDEGSKRTNLILSVSDNGVGIPNNLDIENLDSLGLLLVTSLVEQIDGELEIKRNTGTEFIIKFTVTEKNNKVSISDSKKYGESPKFHN